MTFCVALKVREGLVGIADTRVTSGSEPITARKINVFQLDRHPVFLMTSGLRSVRDKALTYFREALAEEDLQLDKVYKAVNLFAEQLRRVTKEDGKALTEAGFDVNLHAIIGGQLERDEEHRLYMVYPQGNWVEVGEGHPYFAIGESSYAKPVMDRSLDFDCSMELALKIGFLGFNAARASATVVDYPIDVALYHRDTNSIAEHRYEAPDLAAVSEWWQQRIRASVAEAPSEWMEAVMSKLPAAAPTSKPIETVTQP